MGRPSSSSIADDKKSIQLRKVQSHVEHLKLPDVNNGVTYDFIDLKYLYQSGKLTTKHTIL